MACYQLITFMIAYLPGLKKGEKVARKPVPRHSCQASNYALRGMNKITLWLHAAICTVDLLSWQLC